MAALTVGTAGVVGQQAGLWGSAAAGAAATAGSVGTSIFNVRERRRENEIMRQREDTAVQRRAADMRAAGINPLLAAGQPAAAAGTQSGTMDTNYSDEAMIGMNIRNLQQQNLNLMREGMKTDAETKAILQEYRERARNINWYRKNGMVSDRPPNVANEILQTLAAIRGNLPDAMKIAEEWGSKAANAANQAGEKATSWLDRQRQRAKNFAEKANEKKDAIWNRVRGR